MEYYYTLAAPEIQFRLTEQVKENVEEYLSFPVEHLFRAQHEITNWPLCYLFGGAVRDIIAQQKIHDLDILCGSQTMPGLSAALERHGFQHCPTARATELHSLYRDISCIQEPRVYHKGDRLVQLIRPNPGAYSSILLDYSYGACILAALSNVDLSCCGLAWNGEHVFETIPGAFLDAKEKRFYRDPQALMYSSDRTHKRAKKLIARGWKEYTRGSRNY